MKKYEYVLTKEGKEKLERELVELRANRPKAVEALNIARSQGDLRENSAYQATKAKLVDIDHRIVKLELMVRQSIVVSNVADGTVQIGSVVTIKNNSGSMTVTIVGETEQDPKQRKISVKSPLARVLYQKKAGDNVKLETPNGIVLYTIEKVL